MVRFISNHATETVVGLLITICLGIFAYNFQELIQIRARVASLERAAAAQDSETKALKDALDRRTKEIECRIDLFSKQLDHRFESLTQMMETLINVLSAARVETTKKG